MDNPEYAYLCYSRSHLAGTDIARFERVYLDRDKCKQWIDRKNCQSRKYYFWVAEKVSD